MTETIQSIQIRAGSRLSRAASGALTCEIVVIAGAFIFPDAQGIDFVDILEWWADAATASTHATLRFMDGPFEMRFGETGNRQRSRHSLLCGSYHKRGSGRSHCSGGRASNGARSCSRLLRFFSSNERRWIRTRRPQIRADRDAPTISGWIVNHARRQNVLAGGKEETWRCKRRRVQDHAVSSGYIHFYFAKNIVPEIAAIEKWLESIALHLEQPGTQRAFSISPIGDQVIVSRSWIETQIASSLPVSIQWWHTGAEDVYCRFRPLASENQWCLEFGFDGVGAEQREALIATTCRYFIESCSRSEAEALVIDRMGLLEETDWDAVIRGHARPADVPDILILPLRVIRSSGMAYEKIDECSSHVVVRSSNE